MQVRRWSGKHASLAGFRLHPVLPLVLYTGTRKWDRLGNVVDLIEGGELFAAVTPSHQPLFLNLAQLPAEKLAREGGFFGQVLRLVRSRRRPLSEFKKVILQVVERLQTMPAQQRLRWLEFLWYIHALVYHERHPSEQPELHQVLDSSVHADDIRQEVSTMRRTIADVLEEKGKRKGKKQGKIEGLQESLVRIIRKRFGEVAPQTVTTIQATADLDRLRQWLDATAMAKSLDEVGIGPL